MSGRDGAAPFSVPAPNNKMKRTAIIITILIFMSGWGTSSAMASASSPPPKPSDKDKCPVCGMFVYKYPDWVCATVLSTGKTLYFDGAKDLFRFLKGSSGDTPGVEASWVTEYYGLKMIDATKAFYVIGSDVYGPMGHELIAFATREEAEEFMADHKGRKILLFHDIDAEVLKGLK